MYQITKERVVTKVVIDVEPEVVKFLGEQKYYNGFLKEEKYGEHVRMTFLTGSLRGFSRWFMLYGDHAKIIEPLELNDMVAEIAENILKKLEYSQMLLT